MKIETFVVLVGCVLALITIMATDHLFKPTPLTGIHSRR